MVRTSYVVGRMAGRVTPMADNEIRFDDGAAYERYMGKWSQLAGQSFLEWLRAEPKLRILPCIIYSGSMNPAHVQAAYNCGVTSFVVKPASFVDWVARLETVLKFWMDVAQWPPLPEE